jgi:tRNA (cmo5U34)-methyltransferase
MVRLRFAHPDGRGTISHHLAAAHMTGFFTQDASRAYDEKNRRLAPISDGMHFLIRLALREMPEASRVLCVGVGTGAEILSLSREYPQWRFVGVDPSADMLAVCRERLRDADMLDRCELVCGYVQDAPSGESFDAVLSILVGHFVTRADRPDFYRDMRARLRPGGILIDTEISFDLDSPEFPEMLKDWGRVQALMGASPESLKSLPATLRETLTVLPPAEVESLMRASGFPVPVRFFQAFMITGWHATKV